MGIPKLYSDLYPYSEPAVLVHETEAPFSSPHALTKLVIDGPSLVYYAYNKLLAAKVSTGNSLNNASRSLVEVLPGYAEINRTLLRLLQDFERNGAEVVGIYFDGALPLSKRSTRVERQEKTRAQLESYHSTYPEVIVKIQPGSTNDGPGIDYEKVCWNHQPSSARQVSLPPPPFMVASAIEALLSGDWRHITHVVSSEADVACAIVAKTSGAAVLSSDSDICLYDLGGAGCLALLNSLEKSDEIPASTSQLRVRVIKPREVAAKMNVPSLTHFAFERYTDPYASFATLKKSAQSSATDDDPAWKEAYQAFAVEYDLSQPAIEPVDVRRVSGIDPRFAELIVQFTDNRYGMTPNQKSDEPMNNFHVYLPVLLEDPSRDAAWSYGIEIRQITYSVIAHNTRSQSSSAPNVLEFSRRGSRIVPTKIQCLNMKELLSACDRLALSLSRFIHPRNRVNNVIPANNVSSWVATSSTTPQYPASTSLDVLKWYAFALQHVLRQRATSDKSQIPFEIIRNIFFSSPRSPNSSHTTKPQNLSQTNLTWEHIHLHAKMQAVLYSYRVLTQAVDYALNHHQEAGPQTNPSRTSFEQFIRDLSAKLEPAPAITDLFIPVQDLACLSMEHHSASLNHDLESSGSFDEVLPSVLREFYPEILTFVPTRSEEVQSASRDRKTKKPNANAQASIQDDDGDSDVASTNTAMGDALFLETKSAADYTTQQEIGWIMADRHPSTKRRQSRLAPVTASHASGGADDPANLDTVLIGDDAGKESRRRSKKYRKKREADKGGSRTRRDSDFGRGNVFAVLAED